MFRNHIILMDIYNFLQPYLMLSHKNSPIYEGTYLLTKRSRCNRKSGYHYFADNQISRRSVMHRQSVSLFDISHLLQMGLVALELNIDHSIGV